MLKRKIILIAIVLAVIILIILLPTVLLDFFMAANLLVSFLILLIAFCSRRPACFNLFPMAPLVVTVFGLALNVSLTCLILTHGAKFDGRIIHIISNFAVGSGGTIHLVVGFVIFVMIIAVQVAFITKHSTRISEAAARNNLDYMPQKQMAIEAEFNSGNITIEEATRRRAAMQQAIDFYGAMDGPSKFVVGCVKAGILVTVASIIGSIIIGLCLNREPLFDVMSGVYMRFSIGNGIFFQFTLMLILTAMGIAVGRTVSAGDFGER